ncbi:MAG: hypothetical protein R2856_09050 [Caldilineaceae bacterium]
MRRPPLYKPENGNRVASCYLYENSPTLPKEDVGQLFGAAAKGKVMPMAAD